MLIKCLFVRPQTLKGKSIMSNNKNSLRVLGRTGAREMSLEETGRVTGGQALHTSTLSRDAMGRPVDITQDAGGGGV
jgi:hypothetical protein